MKDNQVIPLTEEDKIEIEMENERMAGNALRVLGVAFSRPEIDEEASLERELIWLGLVGMADPIREGAKELLDVYHHAGIDTVMITGDQSPTAYAVAQQLHINRNEPLEILDSTRLNGIDPVLMKALAEKVQVYSRVSPAHKLKIVRALQASGRTVAMTGDGINDGPALKASDIGIAMGQSGTDVAREVADIVLEDDELETLIPAVREGRTTYQNIRKSVHFFLSTNFSELMVIFAAMAMGIGFPLNVIQLLWINIISDIFPGLALSMEPPEPDVLEQPPRDANAPLLSAADYKKMTYESAVISAGALAAYGYGISRYGLGARAGSMAFQSLTIGQLLHAFSCRSERHSLFDNVKPPTNTYFNVAVGGSLLLQILTMIVPGLRRFLGTTPLNLYDVAVIGGSALIPLAVNETAKKKRVSRK
jgi:Ca2+-transporting ATPase